MKKVLHGFKKLLDDFVVKFGMILLEAVPFIYLNHGDFNYILGIYHI